MFAPQSDSVPAPEPSVELCDRWPIQVLLDVLEGDDELLYGGTELKLRLLGNIRRRQGRNVARDPAVIPNAGSMADQTIIVCVEATH